MIVARQNPFFKELVFSFAWTNKIVPIKKQNRSEAFCKNIFIFFIIRILKMEICYENKQIFIHSFSLGLLIQASCFINKDF